MMRDRTKLLGAASLLAFTMVMAGCGSTGSTGKNPPPPVPSPSPGASNLVVFASDAAADNVLAFNIDVTSISVTDSSGKSTTLTTTPQTLELRHLELAPTLALQAGGLPSGSYGSVTLTLANPKLAVFSGGTVTQVTNATLSNSSVSIPLSSFSLPSGGTQGLGLDFDLASSLSTNASGGFVINPIVRPSVVNSGSSGMEMVDTVGKISAINSSPGNSFNLQLVSGAATAVVTTDANTGYDAAVGNFSGLAVGQYVEVDGNFQGDGSFLANYIELSASTPGLRVEGVVSSVNTTSTSTTINLVVQD